MSWPVATGDLRGLVVAELTAKTGKCAKSDGGNVPWASTPKDL